MVLKPLYIYSQRIKVYPHFTLHPNIHLGYVIDLDVNGTTIKLLEDKGGCLITLGEAKRILKENTNITTIKNFKL